MRGVLGKDYARQNCAMARTLEVVGERWTLLIVRDAFYGVRRFSDFRDHLDIPRAVLADRLNGLVEEGVLTRRPDPDHRGRDLYELTPAGRDLWPVLNALMAWGTQHRVRGPRRRFLHAGCGTALDGHGRCPACGVTPEAGDVLMRADPGASRRDDPVARALREPRRLLEPLSV